MSGYFPHPHIEAHQHRKWFILTTVLLGATMSALDVSIVNVALPTLRTTFGVSLAMIEWVAMAYMLTLTVFLPFFGRLADMFGRAKLYNTGFIVFSLGSLLCGMAWSASFLVIARIVQAVGAGLLQANSVAIITQAFPARERGKAIGIQGAVQAVAMAVGPFVGGVLIAAIGWRAIFYVNIPIGILGTIAALLVLPRHEGTKKESVDYVGTALFAGALALIVLGLNRVGDAGWNSLSTTGLIIAGALLMSLFVLVERKVRHPLIDLRLFGDRTFALGNVAGMISYYVIFAALFLLPFYFEEVLGFGVTLSGALLTPVPLAMAAAAPFAGHISDIYGPRIMTVSGMLLSALSVIALMLSGASVSIPVLIAVLSIMGIGMGMFTPPNNSAIMGSAPKDKLGVAGGILNMMRSLGLILGVDISGLVFTGLRDQELARSGYAGTHGLLPQAVANGAFMHGYHGALIVLLALSVLAMLFSFFNKKGKAAAPSQSSIAEFTDGI